MEVDLAVIATLSRKIWLFKIPLRIIFHKITKSLTSLDSSMLIQFKHMANRVQGIMAIERTNLYRSTLLISSVIEENLW